MVHQGRLSPCPCWVTPGRLLLLPTKGRGLSYTYRVASIVSRRFDQNFWLPMRRNRQPQAMHLRVTGLTGGHGHAAIVTQSWAVQANTAPAVPLGATMRR
jgi:hypothetical protein